MGLKKTKPLYYVTCDNKGCYYQVGEESETLADARFLAKGYGFKMFKFKWFCKWCAVLLNIK